MDDGRPMTTERFSDGARRRSAAEPGWRASELRASELHASDLHAPGSHCQPSPGPAADTPRLRDDAAQPHRHGAHVPVLIADGFATIGTWSTTAAKLRRRGLIVLRLRPWCRAHQPTTWAFGDDHVAGLSARRSYGSRAARRRPAGPRRAEGVGAAAVEGRGGVPPEEGGWPTVGRPLPFGDLRRRDASASNGSSRRFARRRNGLGPASGR